MNMKAIKKIGQERGGYGGGYGTLNIVEYFKLSNPREV